MCLADQDEARLFQLQECLLVCGLYADIFLFQQDGVQARDDEKIGSQANTVRSAHVCRSEATMRSLWVLVSGFSLTTSNKAESCP